MRLTEIGADAKTSVATELDQAIEAYDARDTVRTDIWKRYFA